MNSKPSRSIILACYYAKRVTFLLTRFPSFSSSFIAKLEQEEFDRTNEQTYTGTRRKFTLIDNLNELDQFKQNSANNARYCSIFLIVLYLAHLVKDMLVQMIDYQLVDRRNLESNLVQSIEVLPDNDDRVNRNISQVIISKFACLATNCSRLSEEGPLLIDLSRLPFFKLCAPNLSKNYDSVNIVDPVALLTFTTAAFAVVLIGTMLPIGNLSTPFAHFTLMFILAPTMVTNALQEHLRILLDDLNASWRNFNLNNSPLTSVITSSNTLANRLGTCCAQRFYDGKSRFCGCSEELRQIESVSSNGPMSLAKKKTSFRRRRLEQEYLDDCLPAVRTSWWLTLLSRTYLISFIISASAVFAAFASFLLFMDNRADRMKKVYRNFALEMDHLGCKLWLTSAEMDSITGELIGPTIDLSDLSTDWSLIVELDRVTSYVIVLSVVVLLSYYWIGQMELQCWLYEVRNSCQYLIKLLHNIDEKYNVNFGQNFPQDIKFIRRIPEENKDSHRSMSSLCINIMRNRYMQASNLSIYFSSNMNPEVQLEITNTVESLVDELSDIDDIIKFQYEILEKYYLSIRLFLIYIDEQKQILSVVAAISYPLNYGMAIICITHAKQTNSFGIEPIILMTVGMLIANVLILIPSSFNAKVSYYIMLPLAIARDLIIT